MPVRIGASGLRSSCAVRLLQSLHLRADEDEPGERDRGDDQLQQVEPQRLHVMVADIAHPRQQPERRERDESQQRQLARTATQHAEHQRDEKECGEDRSRLGRTIDDEEHGRYGSHDLERRKARVGEAAVEAAPEYDEQDGDLGKHECCGLGQRHPVDIVVSVVDAQNHEVEQREHARQQEPAYPQALVQFVATGRGSARLLVPRTCRPVVSALGPVAAGDSSDTHVEFRSSHPSRRERPAMPAGRPARLV